VAAKGNTDKIGLVYSPELCGTCHKAYLSEWKTSAHPTVNAMMAFNAACVACHTGQGYVEVIIGGSKTFKPVAEPVGTVCVACHTPHSAQNPGQLRAVGTVKLPTGQEVKEGLAANCAKCHNQRRDAANIRTQIEKTWARGPHEGTSADMLAGVGAWEYPGIKYTSSAHSKLPDACITCHMPKKADGKTSHDFKPSLAACQSCHPGLTTFNVKAKGDYDGDGKIEGVQDEVEGLLALLEAKLPTLEYPAAVQALKTPAQRAAAYNTLFVEHDWSKGIHNTSYAVQLLQSAYKDLTGTDVPGATLLIPAGPSAGTLPPAALPKTGEIPTLPIVLILLVGSLAVLAGSMVRRRA
jgi:predicted CXXCH cytochrome family protein